MTERVLVAMSGGVDSSVAAALLLEAGHDVVGATLKLWGGESDSGCCSVADVDDARSVARRLGIEHHIFNFGDDFDEHVVAPYVADHAAGRTPNPCIECNRHLKFDRLAPPGRRSRLRRRRHRPPRPDRRASATAPAASRAAPTPPRTSPTSSTCSTRRRWPASASRSATSPRPTCAPRPPGSGSPPPTSPTARTCASSRPPVAATAFLEPRLDDPPRHGRRSARAAPSGRSPPSSWSPSASATASACPAAPSPATWSASTSRAPRSPSATAPTCSIDRGRARATSSWVDGPVDGPLLGADQRPRRPARVHGRRRRGPLRRADPPGRPRPERRALRRRRGRRRRHRAA